MRPALLVLALLAVAAAAPVAPAGAATVSVEYQRTVPAQPGTKGIAAVPPGDVFVEHVVDADGAANRLLVDATGRVRDAAVPLTPGAGCSADAGGWVTCLPQTAPGHTVALRLAIDTGAGDDVVDLAGGAPPPAVDVPTVDLGAGDDVAQVADGRWLIHGGPGADALSTTAPDPWAAPYYNRGDPERWSGTTWDGGTGPDRVAGPSVLVSYAGRTVGVRVTPDGVADDGEPGEGDQVGADVGGIVGGDGADELHSSGHVVEGGPGDDRIVGTDVDRPANVAIDARMQRPEFLEGGDGDDVVSGGGGADQVMGGPGADVVDGGPGDDVVDGGPGADHVLGGEGDDTTPLNGGGDGPTSDGAPDVWEGGPGIDSITLGTVDGPPVDVSLDGRADDGLPGEGDDVASDWEHVTIESGRLTGDDGPNTLTIEANGTVDGRGGDDTLSGGNTLIGGPGHDVLAIGTHLTYHPIQGTRIDVDDGEADTVTCSDRERVLALHHDARDRVDGCFSLGSAYVGLLPGATHRDRATLVIDVYCYGHQRCRGTVVVRAGRRSSRVLGRARIDARADPTNAKRQTFRMRIRRPRGLPARCGTLRATVRFASPFDPRGARETTAAAGPCQWAKRR